MIICRDGRHDWQPYIAEHNTYYHYLYEVKTCSRCYNERERYLDEDGRVLSVKINYVNKDYLAKGLGRVTGDAMGPVRLAAMHANGKVVRVRGKAAQEDPPRSAAAKRALLNGESDNG